MLGQLRKYLIFGVIGAIIYFFLSHHIIFIEKKVRLLPKKELTLLNTFTSMESMNYDTIIKNKVLREAGIIKLLFEMGKITEVDRDRYYAQYDMEYDDYVESYE